MRDTVLIIETDPQVGDTIECMVEAAGYAARSVASVDAALTVLTATPVRAILTSRLYMSTLKMIALPWLAKQVQPGVGIVFTSAGEPVNVKGVGSLDGCLPKPFSVDDIARAIDALPAPGRLYEMPDARAARHAGACEPAAMLAPSL